MEYLFALLVLVTIPMLVWSFLRHRHIAYTVLASWVLIGVINTFSLKIACEDGWNSPSIGRQGACSHHGGVSSEVTDLGVMVLVACGLFLLVSWRWKSTQDQAKASAASEAKAAMVNTAPTPNYPPVRSQLPFVPKLQSLHDYEAFVICWLKQGLSPDQIASA